MYKTSMVFVYTNLTNRHLSDGLLMHASHLVIDCTRIFPEHLDNMASLVRRLSVRTHTNHSVSIADELLVQIHIEQIGSLKLKSQE